MFEEFRREKIWGGAKMGANVDRTLSIKKQKSCCTMQWVLPDRLRHIKTESVGFNSTCGL